MIGRQRVAALCLAALVVVTATVAGVGTGAAQDEDGTDLPPAEEIYVEDDGDAVLVYDENASGVRTEFGVDVGRSLLHALVVTDADTESVQASGNALLTRDRFDGNATLSVPRPETLTDLSVDIEGTRTSENAAFDATAQATIDSEQARIASLAERASTTGNVTLTPDRFRAAGEFDATLANPLGAPQHQSFRITERDGTYVLEAAQNYTVNEYERGEWNTTANARETLEERYASLAEAYGGTAEVSLDAHEFTEVREGAYRLDVEYTIVYRNIEDGLTRQLTGALGAAEEVDLSQSQLDEIETRIEKLTVDEVSARYDQRRKSIDAAFRVDLGNYNEVVYAALDVAESVETENASLNANLSRFRKTFEAQQAASLERRVTFQASVEAKSRTESAFRAEAHYRTNNWGAYVDELEQRGIERADITYELHAKTVGDRIDASAAVEVSQKDLVDRITDAAFNATDGRNEARKYMQTFRKAGFRRARMDVSLRDGRVRFEAGAAFENVSELRAAVDESGQFPQFTSMVGRTDNDTLRTYVRVQNVVPENASESDVRSLSYVNESTTVHLAGTWDREFPSVDTETAREFLGLTPTPTPTDGGTGGGSGTDHGGTESSVPGFGLPVAIVALLAAVLLSRR